MSALMTAIARRSRLMLLTDTLTVWRDGLQIASAAGRVVPIGGESGAYAPVARAAEQGGLRSSHLGMLEGTVNAINGDEVHDGDQVFYVRGVTAWQGLTAVALELPR